MLAFAYPASAAGPLYTALTDQETFSGPEAELAFSRVRASGATMVRLTLHWDAVAPRGPVEPGNPADPVYRWDDFDRKVRLALARGLQPIVQISRAPVWAQGRGSSDARPSAADRAQGAFRPDPVAFGQFAKAAATRFSGRFANLPRLRYWQAWNEPNANVYLAPQFVRGRAASPAWYRQMVNRFAAAVHGVRRDNVVVAGGLSPFTVNMRGTVVIGPLRFMRELLCLSAAARPRPTCRDRAQFDVWAHHPYTSGGPTHHAFNPDDVSLGDLPEMRRLLDAAKRAGKIVSRGRPGFWVTEFGWDTKPPDRGQAVPLRLHGRWVAEALYRMWKAGVNVVTWLQLRDGPYPDDPYQSGLYFRGGASLRADRAKPALTAFRFPFVAFRERNSVLIWGRTPSGVAGRVAVEARAKTGWRRLALLRTNRHGIFSRRFAVEMRTGHLRARLLGSRRATALPFSLTRPPDRFVRPFG